MIATSGNRRRRCPNTATAPPAGRRGRESETISCRVDDHMPLRFLALGLAAQPSRRYGVVDHLALERSHRLQLHCLAGLPGSRHGFVTDPRELLPAAGPEAGDVQHEAAAF